MPRATRRLAQVLSSKRRMSILTTRGRWKEKYRAEKHALVRMEFKKFVNAFVRIPALVVKTGRRIILRLLSWNPYQHIFLRALDHLEHPLRC